jgi:hypothetical protein
MLPDMKKHFVLLTMCILSPLFLTPAAAEEAGKPPIDPDDAIGSGFSGK